MHIAPHLSFTYTEDTYIIMLGKKVFLPLLILILLLGNVVVLTKYAASRRQLKDAEQVIQSRSYNGNALNFMQLFIEKVLRAQGEVNFEDRLELETKVRDLKDDDVISAWNAFVNSHTEEEAQDAVKNLLGILVQKVKAS